MDERYIALAVPVFFVAIVLEFAVNVRRGDARYRLHDTLSNLSCGVGQRVLALLFEAVAVLAYAWVYAHARLFELRADAALTWALSIVGVDLCFYWLHRTNHRVNFLWAAHAVHHQSEEYNLSAALRQSWLEPVFAVWFYLPLALLGVPPAVHVAVATANTLYQFWVHNRAVRSLGPLEWVLNTPSHHRVHHGIDPAYIDKNYGGMFIVWDRLFGTFEPEAREPYYGTVKPLARWSAFYANAFEWLRIASLARAAGTLGEKLYAPFAPPEWRPAALGGPAAVPAVDPGTYARFDLKISRAAEGYAVAQFVLLVGATTALLWWHRALPAWLAVAVGAWVLAGLGSVGALLEGRGAWARWLEGLRWGALPALVRRGALAYGADERAAWTLFALSFALNLAMALWCARACDGLRAEPWPRPDASREGALEASERAVRSADAGEDEGPA